MTLLTHTCGHRAAAEIKAPAKRRHEESRPCKECRRAARMAAWKRNQAAGLPALSLQFCSFDQALLAEAIRDRFYREGAAAHPIPTCEEQADALWWIAHHKEHGES